MWADFGPAHIPLSLEIKVLSHAALVNPNSISSEEKTMAFPGVLNAGCRQYFSLKR